MNNNLINNHDIYRDAFRQFQIEKKKELEKHMIAESIKFSVFTGPLYCLSTNLQLLSKSSNISFESRGGILSSLSPKNIGDKSKLLPFKPSLYKNYRDCIYYIGKQGVFGFFKGNTYRLMFFFGTNRLKRTLDYYTHHVKANRILKEIILYSAADMILHPFLFLESRYSIQNRRKGFRIYRNLFHVLHTSYKELYVGSLYSIPRNIMFVLGVNSGVLFDQWEVLKEYSYVISLCIAHVLSYPLLTIQRNSIFRSNYVEYLPPRESNMPRYIFENFGVLGFYRGFFCYSLAVGLWHYFVPKLANRKLYSNDSFRINLFEEDDEEYEDDSNHKEESTVI